MRGWAAAGALHAFVAVALGAFAAHGLKKRVAADLVAIFDTGARYHLVHALGLIAVAWLATQRGDAASLPGWLLSAGIVLFSGSLYALALTGARGLGAITPLGGLCFLAGWLAFAWVAWRG